MIDFRFLRSGFVRYGTPAFATAAILFVLGQAMVLSLSSPRPIEREFSAFYVVGRILNQYPPEKIYDAGFQNEVARSLLPHAPAALNLPYGHAPFEAVIYRPLAWFSHEQAYRAWLLVSVGLLCGGFALVWRSLGSVPRSRWPTPLLLLLSFYPVLGGTLYPGQVAALTFFWMALAIHLDRRNLPALAGVALAPCLAKPTLLLLLLPMLFVARRWRMLMGFALGTFALAGLSLANVGWAGCDAYVRMLLQFGDWSGARRSSLNTAIYIDLNMFFGFVSGRDGWLPLVALVCVTSALIPLLVRLWLAARRDGQSWGVAWATTIIWTMLLNAYTPFYDAVVVPLAALMMADFFYASAGRPPKAYWALLTLLYVTALVCAPRGRGSPEAHIQTLVLMAVGGYQLAVGLAMSRRRRADPGAAARP
jgi:hypothetical protein